MEAFGFIGAVYLLAGIIQLIILIVLIVKFLQLTADVKQFKDLYTERSKELLSSINTIASIMKNSSHPKINEPVKEKKENIKTDIDETYNVKTEVPIQELPIIDENSDEYKQRLRKWKVLKGKGFTEQAIREYLEYTKRDMESAIEYINSL